MRRQLLPALRMLLVLSVLCGVAYPLAVTGIAQSFFEREAEGSLITRDGTLLGSELIGQSFTRPEYFHPRPSAAGDGYDGSASSASNLGPTNPDFIAAVEQRAVDYRTENGLAGDAEVPVDAVTASGSGLDPHISVANARLQIGRVAATRGITPELVERLVSDHTTGRDLGVLGERVVDVLELNLALDALAPPS